MSDPVHIFLAEDNLADVQIIQEILNQKGIAHTLDFVSDGEEALRFAESAGQSGKPCPDLFVLDLHLPKVEGSEILRRFRANEHCAQTPVIVLSGLLSPRERAAVAGYSGVSFLSKPSSLEEIIQIGRHIDQLLNRAQDAGLSAS